MPAGKKQSKPHASTRRVEGKRATAGAVQPGKRAPKQPSRRNSRAAPAAAWAMSEVKAFAPTDGFAAVFQYYQQHQVALIRGVCPAASSTFGPATVRSTLLEAPAVLEATWSHESSQDALNPKDVYGAAAPNDSAGLPPGHWYCSFIAQSASAAKSGGQPRKAVPDSKREAAALAAFHAALPISNFDFLKGGAARRDKGGISHTAPVWVFLGRAASREMPGRPEHTDSVSHEGTWHLQVAGAKRWAIRPAADRGWGHGGPPQIVSTPPAGKATKPRTAERAKQTTAPALIVECQPGDILIINTRLWFHATTLPVTGPRGISMSYARDFLAPALRRPGAVVSAAGVRANAYMNVDSVYAERDLTAGTTVLTEADMPDCALMRDADPNCAVAEDEDGAMALVAIKDIACGDWLTVAPTSSDDDDDDTSE